MFRERGYLPDNGGAALLELIERGSHDCNDMFLDRLESWILEEVSLEV